MVKRETVVQKLHFYKVGLNLTPVLKVTHFFFKLSPKDLTVTFFWELTRSRLIEMHYLLRKVLRLGQ